MKKHLISTNSDNLLIFFSGWGCDEHEFEHLSSNSDVLILYDYTDIELDFDFEKYKEFNLMAFSAGVFVASIIKFDFKINRRIAIDGNPYLFDEKLGLSKDIQELLCNITEENADEFARNYLVKTEAEYQKFHPSKRTLASCMAEFNSLKDLYSMNYQNIKDIFSAALIGEDDKIFNITEQKKFYGKRLNIIKDARHNPFFKLTHYEQIVNLCK